MYGDRNIGDSYALIPTIIILPLVPIPCVIAFHIHKERDHCPRQYDKCGYQRSVL